MAKRRSATARLFDTLNVQRHPSSIDVGPATDAELDQVELALDIRLPASYRAFMKRFGPGELQGWVRLNPIAARRRNDWTVTLRTREMRAYLPTEATFFPNHEWLAQLVYFGSSGGGDEYAFHPDEITSRKPHECRFYLLRRMDEERPVAAGNSFAEFLTWVDHDVRSWSDADDDIHQTTGIHFAPLYARFKKAPGKRLVQAWLRWNSGTIRDLARAVREDGQWKVLPILADALEEAGCTNADLLQSCRSSTPEVDGLWALEVLLGPAKR